MFIPIIQSSCFFLQHLDLSQLGLSVQITNEKKIIHRNKSKIATPRAPEGTSQKLNPRCAMKVNFCFWTLTILELPKSHQGKYEEEKSKWVGTPGL